MLNPAEVQEINNLLANGARLADAEAAAGRYVGSALIFGLLQAVKRLADRLTPLPVEDLAANGSPAAPLPPPREQPLATAEADASA